MILYLHKTFDFFFDFFYRKGSQQSQREGSVERR